MAYSKMVRAALRLSDSNYRRFERKIAKNKIVISSKFWYIYYEITIKNALSSIDKIYYLINTDDIRNYLTKYQLKNNASKQTIDNVRRIISTFFSWLENEDYIIKSPVRRIKKIKIGKKVKEVLTDEMVEKIKAFCKNDRDLAIVNFLLLCFDFFS